jgi:hypothetical protein
MQKNLLIVFVKYPRPGMVKSRLAAAIGREQAAQAYRELAEKTLTQISPTRQDSYDLAVCFDPASEHALFREWLGVQKKYFPQQGDDLGQRMHHAFARAFHEGYTKAVIIGSDCPGISRDSINRSFGLLDGHDAVVGPARDGGYYLIGLKQALPELFCGIDWSTDRVLQQTRDVLQKLSLSCALLPMLRDVDRPEDWQWYCNEYCAEKRDRND